MRKLLVVLLAATSVAANAQVTISSLPSAGTMTGGEILPIVQGGSTKQTTTGAIVQTITKGTQFSATGGIGSAASTISNGEPQGGTFAINGQTGFGSFSGFSATATSHPTASDFFLPGDQFALTPNLLRVTDTETLLGKIRFGALVDNIVSSNRTNGPANASIALGIRSIKPNWTTSTATQETDGLYVQTKTGLKGDTSAFLGDAGGITGGISFVNLLEGTASLFNPDGSQARVIRVQLAAFDQPDSSSFGANIYAQKGAVDIGLLFSSTTATDYFTNFATAYRNNALKWQVDGIGNEYLAGSVAAPRGIHQFNGGQFTSTANYVGSVNDSAVVGISGTPIYPDANQGAAGVFEKSSTAPAFNGLAGLANKTITSTGARATGVYGEAMDLVGGATSFVEGGRFQGTLVGGSNGSAYGAICAAGTNPTGVTTPAYLIGCEGEVDNQIGPDAPTFPSFNKDKFSAAFLATNGVGGTPRYAVDAAFAVNHYSIGKFKTGMLLTDAVSDTGIAATSGTSLTAGIDLTMATFSNAAIKTPGFTVNPTGAVAASGYSAGATVGVSCAAGTVSLATLTVTNGIITHC